MKKKRYIRVLSLIISILIGMACITSVPALASEDISGDYSESIETEESDMLFDGEELEEIPEDSDGVGLEDLLENSDGDILQDSIVSEENADALEYKSPASVAGIRLVSPISAIVGKPYEQKLLNILNKAGDKHELHYICEWFGGGWKSREKVKDELPPGFSMNNDGTISGTPTEVGTLYLWFKVIWESNADSFDTLPDGYSNEYMSAVIISVLDEDDLDNGRIEIGSNPETITVDKDFVIPSNSEKWYKFIAPRNVVLYSKSISQYDGWGDEKTEWGIFDKNGCHVKPYQVEDAECVSVGEMYYLHLKNPSDQNITARLNSYWYGEGTIPDGEGSTVEGFIKKQTVDEEHTYDSNISVIKKGVEKSFNGDSNSMWDIYRISGDLVFNKGLLTNRFARSWASVAVVAPYKVHFEESAFSYDISGEYNITSQISTDTIPDALDNLSVPAGSSIMGQSVVTYVCSDEYLEGTSTCLFDVFVPSGTTLKYQDGAYRGDLRENGDITPSKSAINISSISVTGIKNSYTYTGKNLKPAPTITYDGKKLSPIKDYTIKYSANKNVGTAKILITGCGNYTGTKTASFKIIKANNPLKLKASSQSYIQKKLIKVKKCSVGASKGQGKITYSLSSTAKKAKIKVSSKGVVSIPKKCKKGTYKITVKAAGNANYKTISKTFKIVIK